MARDTDASIYEQASPFLVLSAYVRLAADSCSCSCAACSRCLTQRPDSTWNPACRMALSATGQSLFACRSADFDNFKGEKPININNFAGLSRKWVGVKLFMCFPFSWGKRETHKQIPRKSWERPGESRDSPGIIPGQSRENFVYVFSCLFVFFPCPIIIASTESMEMKFPCQFMWRNSGVNGALESGQTW